jgi:hypothetical protein
VKRQTEDYREVRVGISDLLDPEAGCIAFREIVEPVRVVCPLFFKLDFPLFRS